MATSTGRLTAEEAIWRYGEPGEHTYEFVDGELIPVMPAGARHGRIMVEIGRHLGNFVREHGGGQVYADAGFVLGTPGDPERMRGPDVAFVSGDAIAAAGGEPGDHFFRGAIPELAVEIFSPTNEKEPLQFQQRVRDLLDAGVRILWVIYPPSRYAVVYHHDGSARMLRENEFLDGEYVLPGLRILLAELLD